VKLEEVITWQPSSSRSKEKRGIRGIDIEIDSNVPLTEKMSGLFGSSSTTGSSLFKQPSPSGLSIQPSPVKYDPLDLRISKNNVIEYVASQNMAICRYAS
jgi:hypothetical protein